MSAAHPRFLILFTVALPVLLESFGLVLAMVGSDLGVSPLGLALLLGRRVTRVTVNVCAVFRLGPDYLAIAWLPAFSLRIGDL